MIENIAASGMNVAGVQLNATASNIANANTQNYGATETRVTANPYGGAYAEQVKTQNQVNLNEEMVNLKKAEFMYNANGEVLATSKNLIDYWA